MLLKISHKVYTLVKLTECLIRESGPDFINTPPPAAAATPSPPPPTGGGGNSPRMFRAPPQSDSKQFQNQTRRKAHLTRQGFQEHHIISHTNRATKNHQLIRLAGFDLQSRANKIFLPKDKTVHGKRSIHCGRHYKVVSEDIKMQMDMIVQTGKMKSWSQSQYRAKLDAFLSDMRQQLKAGNIALNKNHRFSTKN